MIPVKPHVLIRTQLYDPGLCHFELIRAQALTMCDISCSTAALLHPMPIWDTEFNFKLWCYSRASRWIVFRSANDDPGKMQQAARGEPLHPTLCWNHVPHCCLPASRGGTAQWLHFSESFHPLTLTLIPLITTAQTVLPPPFFPLFVLLRVLYSLSLFPLYHPLVSQLSLVVWALHVNVRKQAWKKN